jgi:hypothetical protein
MARQGYFGFELADYNTYVGDRATLFLTNQTLPILYRKQFQEDNFADIYRCPLTPDLKLTFTKLLFFLVSLDF